MGEQRAPQGHRHGGVCLVSAQLDASDARGCFERFGETLRNANFRPNWVTTSFCTVPAFTRRATGIVLSVVCARMATARVRACGIMQTQTRPPTVRGQYMSAFVSIVKGEYDALLQWPFSYKVRTSKCRQLRRVFVVNSPNVNACKPA